MTDGTLLCFYVLESIMHQILVHLDYGGRAETEFLGWAGGHVAIIKIAGEFNI